MGRDRGGSTEYDEFGRAVDRDRRDRGRDRSRDRAHPYRRGDRDDRDRDARWRRGGSRSRSGSRDRQLRVGGDGARGEAEAFLGALEREVPPPPPEGGRGVGAATPREVPPPPPREVPPPPPPPLAEEQDDGLGGLDPEMMAMMGFAGFGSTSGQHVDDPNANVSAVNKKTTRRARQYMNRPGGFNRPLPEEKTGQRQNRI